MTIQAGSAGCKPHDHAGVGERPGMRCLRTNHDSQVVAELRSVVRIATRSASGETRTPTGCEAHWDPNFDRGVPGRSAQSRNVPLTRETQPGGSAPSHAIPGCFSADVSISCPRVPTGILAGIRDGRWFRRGLLCAAQRCSGHPGQEHLANEVGCCFRRVASRWVGHEGVEICDESSMGELGIQRFGEVGGSDP